MLGGTLNMNRSFAGEVRVARGLLTKLRRRDITDLLLVAFGVVFFFSVVLYIMLDRTGWI